MTIKHKDKQRFCRLTSSGGNGLVCLGLLDIELLDIMSVMSSRIDLQTQGRDINEQNKERESQANKQSNTNPKVVNKDIYKKRILFLQAQKRKLIKK